MFFVLVRFVCIYGVVGVDVGIRVYIFSFTSFWSVRILFLSSKVFEMDGCFFVNFLGVFCFFFDSG